MLQLNKPDKQLYGNFLDVRKRLNQYFINGTPLVNSGSKSFTITDTVSAAILSNTNMYLVGSRGSGKTLLSEAIQCGIFGNRGFYLRGDINLRLKDLLVKLDLQGKNEDEIYQIAESIRFTFALIDELNRTPGILQNQFLNIADGYVEIRGKKYYFGKSNYFLMVATANPVRNGEHTGVFDEDLSLLDRIPLIINTDEVPLKKGDIFTISEKAVDKTKIQVADLESKVIDSYLYLKSKIEGDVETAAAFGLIKEMLYSLFRYVKKGKERIDKAQQNDWRDKLATGGKTHGAGSTISYCSDIPIRTLESAGKMAFAMYEIARIENALMDSIGITISKLSVSDFAQAYLSALKLALNYDRRFIPTDLPQQLGKTHAELIDSVFEDAWSRMAPAGDSGGLTNAIVLITEFLDAMKNGKEKEARGMANFAGKNTTDQMVKLAYDVMVKKLEDLDNQKLETKLRNALDGVA